LSRLRFTSQALTQRVLHHSRYVVAGMNDVTTTADVMI
jgi:hypothetical protein